jgi:hypothetical protein
MLQGYKPTYAFVDELEDVPEPDFLKNAISQRLGKAISQRLETMLDPYMAGESKGWLDAVRYAELSFQALEEKRAADAEEGRQARIAAEEKRVREEARREIEHLRALPTFGMF